MVNDYTEWERPTWLPERDWTPAQEWGRITGRQDPYWEARQPMQQLGQRLQARYLLGAPQMGTGEWEAQPGFEDYVGGWIGEGPGAWQATDYNALLARARAAAAATRDPVGEYMSQFASNTDPWREAAWYAGMFNPTAGFGAEGAAANQLAVATMLAQQRQGGGGAYGGAMGQAIAAAMQNVQQYRQDLDEPRGSFLDWYVNQPPAAADEV